MENSVKRKSLQEYVSIAIILLFAAFSVISDFVKITYIENPFYNQLISKIIQQACGIIAGILILLKLNIQLFKKPQHLLYLIPCLIIAIDNFQFSSYFNGRMELIHTKPIDFLLFFLSCMCIGLFEEIIFRGIVFSVLADRFSKNKKGFLKTYVISSVIFGLAHLFNGFSFGTVLQVGYTVLTGGLFAFCLIMTKNILCCALVHGIYNFCGLLFDHVQGLGNGVVFDIGTVITMAVVSVVVGIFVLYKVYHYPDEDRKDLYARLGIAKE